MANVTLLLIVVSVMGILKIGLSVNFQVLSGMTTESVYITSLLQDNRNRKEIRNEPNAYLLLPFIIESSVFSFIPAILAPCLIFIEPGKAIILQEVMRNRGSIMEFI